MKRFAFGAAVFVLGCAGRAAPTESSSRASLEDPAEFAFGALDGQVVTSENTRGRVTALLFVTTYDLPSQVAARRLSDVYRSHVPRFNAAAVVLEAAENGVLAEVFRSSLGLLYPVALADVVELRASRTFSSVSAVPTLVMLDREGHVVFRRFGGFEANQIQGWLRKVEHGAAPE